jgi:hypothetical protein
MLHGLRKRLRRKPEAFDHFTSLLVEEEEEGVKKDQDTIKMPHASGV